MVSLILHLSGKKGPGRRLGLSEFEVTSEIIQSASLASRDVDTEGERCEVACRGSQGCPSLLPSACPTLLFVLFANEAPCEETELELVLCSLFTPGVAALRGILHFSRLPYL